MSSHQEQNQQFILQLLTIFNSYLARNSLKLVYNEDMKTKKGDF